MAKYGQSYYSNINYGEVARTTLSVEPLTAEAIDYDKVSLTWSPATGTYTALRLVRNSYGYPETQEDGVILWQVVSDSTPLADFIDGVDNFTDSDTTNNIALKSGGYVYYRMWIQNAGGAWAVAGETYALIPRQHATLKPDKTTLINTQNKMMDLLPRVFTSKSQSYIDEVDQESDLFQFLTPFAFTQDELTTYADLLIPDFTGQSTNPETLSTQFDALGIDQAAAVPMKNQKRLLREAMYTYQRKGTMSALSTGVEAVCGFDPKITTSTNLMLSLNDSSFESNVGFWLPFGNCALSVVKTIIPPTTEAYAIEKASVGQVVVTTANAFISNGADFPLTRGIPVSAGGVYEFSYYIRTADGTTGTRNVTPSISWYDSKGALIGSPSTGSALSTSTSWARKTFSAEAPGFETTAISGKLVSNVVTITVATGHTFTTGDSVVVSATAGAPYAGTFTLTDTTSTSVTYSVINADLDNLAFTNATIRKNTSKAYFASVKLLFGNTGTYYLDMMQFSLGAQDSFREARGVDIYLNPAKINYITNPSFETNVTGWTTRNVSAATSSSQALYGSKSAYLTIAGSATTSGISVSPTTAYMPPVTAGQTYTYSIYVKDVDTAKQYKSSIDFYDSTPTFITGSGVSGNTTTVTTGSWTRVTVTAVAPVGAKYARPYTYSATAFIAGDAGKHVYFDGAMFEQSISVNDYYDGSLPVDYGAVWSGTAHASTTYYYPNKVLKLTRTVMEIERILPHDTPWVLRSAAGVESSGIS